MSAIVTITGLPSGRRFRMKPRRDSVSIHQQFIINMLCHLAIVPISIIMVIAQSDCPIQLCMVRWSLAVTCRPTENTSHDILIILLMIDTERHAATPFVHRSSIFHSNINKLWCNAAIRHMNLPRSSPNCFCCPGSILYFLGSVFLPRVKRLISWSTGLIRHICIACPPIRCKAFSEDFSMWSICVLKVLIRMSLHTPPPYYIQ